MAPIEDKDLEVIIKAARAGGEVLRSYFGQTLSITEKSNVMDLQTEADRESEKFILDILKIEFPSYNIFSEEIGEINNNSDYTFFIDPLDATNNFVLGIPHFSVSIGLLYKGEAIAGVVYQPILDQLFKAKKGGGAYLNDKKIQVSDVIEPKRFTVAYAYSYPIATQYTYLSNIMASLYKMGVKRVMNNWSAAYECCMLASGKIESIIIHSIGVHDFAAGKLIALEAGAKVAHFSGEREKVYTSSDFIIGNSDSTNDFISRTVKSFS